MKAFIQTVIILGLFVYAGYYLWGKLKPATWDLMICSSLMSDGAQCEDISTTIPGYKSRTECMERGYVMAKQGFECGKNCRPSATGLLNVCDVVCNKNGCDD